ncbi:MAG: 1,2-phenylacetyl-CoA epoxidase subunit PaaD [Acidimicrobiia bacterium]
MTTLVDPARLDELVREIEDPELPHVTIGDLGIVRSVEVDGHLASVVLTPTYTGCPATEQIRDDVEAAIRSAGFEPNVTMAMSPAWTTDWITSRGHERLRAAGIAPPPPAAEPGTVPVDLPVACPRCGSRRTRLISHFGGTACKASYDCAACAEPFEHFKSL